MVRLKYPSGADVGAAEFAPGIDAGAGHQPDDEGRQEELEALGQGQRLARAGDPHAQDDLDAATLFSIVGGEVIPLFYERDAAGLPARWIARVRASMQRSIPRFSADRMIRDYVAALYREGDRGGGD